MRKELVFFYVFIVVFAAGLLVGYFVERVGLVYTETEIDKLRNEVENMQIQEMFLAGGDVDCKLMFSSMGKLSYDLYSLVESLKTGNPGSAEFQEAKIQADFLSLRAWIIARNVRETCTHEVLPVLFFYSNDCGSCEEQNQILQETKEKHPSVLVYSVDFGSEQPAMRLIKDAYGIWGTPTIIINNDVYGKLSQDVLENIVCEEINCTG